MAEQPRAPARRSESSLAIDTLHVDSFRGLKDVELEHLGRVNLLVGTNNAGKTSILESIAVLNSPFDPFEWSTVVRARETRTVGITSDHSSILEAIRWMFPARNGDIWGEMDPLPIKLFSEQGGRRDELTITCEGVQGLLDPDLLRKAFGYRRNEGEPVEDRGLQLTATAHLSQGMLSPVRDSRDWTFWSQIGLRGHLRQGRINQKVQYLAPYAHRNSPANLRRLSEIVKSGRRDDIDHLLSDLDPRIRGVEIVTTDDGRYPKIALRMRDGGLTPQGVLGDGVRRALSIALALRAAANGILLIDEVEAALHVSALDRVYRWLEEAVSSFNVQVFATTHSLEAIEAIIRSVDVNSHSELSGYTLGDDQAGGVKRYTGGMLHRLVRQRGLDIRG